MKTQLMLVCAGGGELSIDTLAANRGFRVVPKENRSSSEVWRWNGPAMGEYVVLIKNAPLGVHFIRIDAPEDKLRDLIGDIRELIPLCSFDDVLEMSSGPHKLEIAAMITPIVEDERLAAMIKEGLASTEVERRNDAVQACAILALPLFQEDLRELINNETDAKLRTDAKDALWACEEDSIGPFLH